MASEKSLILRNAASRERLNKAILHVRAEGIEIPDLVTSNRDIQVAKAQELEYFADTMEAFSQYLTEKTAQTKPAETKSKPAK